MNSKRNYYDEYRVCVALCVEIIKIEKKTLTMNDKKKYIVDFDLHGLTFT